MTLLAAWNFDEASGQLLDASGNGHNATLAGTTSRTADGSGHTSKGLTQSAEEGFTGGLSVFGQSTSRTAMCWVKVTGSGPTDGRICEWFATSDGNSVFRLTLRSTWHVQVWNAAGFARADVTRPTDGLWHHYAGTYDGSNIKSYLDGVLQNTTALAGPVRTDANIFNLIYNTGSSVIVDDLRIYDTALTQSEISALKDQPVSATISLVPANASQAQSADNVLVNERVKYYTFEEGTNGATPTVAGDYLALSGTVTYDTAAAAHGSLGITSTNNSFLTLASGTPDTGAFSVHFTPVAVTSGVPRVITLTDSANSFMCAFRVHTDTHFDVTDGSSTRQAVSTATWTAGTKYWVTGTLSGTGTARTVAVKVYTDDGSTTPVWDSGAIAVTAANSNTWARVRVGNQGGTTGSMRIDDVRLYDSVAFAEPIATVITLAPANAAQAQTSGTPSPTQVHNLTVQGATQAQTAAAPTLVYNSSLAPAAASQTQTSANVVLAQTHVLTVAAASQTQQAGNVSPGTGVVPSAALQAQQSGAPTLTQVHQLVVAGALQGQTAGALSLAQQHALAVAPATQTQVSGTPTLGQLGQLSPASTSQAQTAGSPALTQQHQLAILGAAQSQTSTQVTTSGGTQLAVDASVQAQTSTTVALTQGHQLAVQAAVQGQLAGAPTLPVTTTLVPAGANQSQLAGSPNPTQQHQLVTAPAQHAQLATTTIALTQLQLLIVLSASHAQTATSPLVGQPTDSTLVVQSATHAIRSTNLGDITGPITYSQVRLFLWINGVKSRALIRGMEPVA